MENLMVNLSMVVFHKKFPLVVLSLPNPLPDLESLINKYSKDYDFNRMDLSYVIVEVLEDYKEYSVKK
jgi:hypothetical protein